MINIVTSFFNKKKYNNDKGNLSELRNNEYNHCLIKNIKSPYVKKMHLFIQDDFSLEILDQLVKDLEEKDKIIKIMFNKQPLISDFFEYSLNNLKDEIVMISNSDVYLSKCNDKLINKFIIDDNDVFCLTRHETETTCPLVTNKKICSHDSYIFKSPIDKNIINDSKFKQNLKGSDNLMVFLFQKYGKKTYNPCLQIKIVHMHKSDLREHKYKRINNTNFMKDYKFVYAPPCKIDPDTFEFTFIWK